MKAEALFVESSAAAQSQKNLWTRMASTYGCMQICLTREHLIIKPRWFIGWLIKLLGLDLFHVVPTSRIQKVERSGRWFNAEKILVSFKKNGSEHKILLYLKKHKAFLDQIKQISSM